MQQSTVYPQQKTLLLRELPVLNMSQRETTCHKGGGSCIIQAAAFLNLIAAICNYKACHMTNTKKIPSS